MNLAEKKVARLKFLRSLYDSLKGEAGPTLDYREVGEDVGLSAQDSAQVMRYLADEGLLESVTLGGGITITHAGVLEIEAGMEEPSKPTEHFPPAANVFIVHNHAPVTNSPMVIGSPGATVTNNVTTAMHELVDKVDALEEASTQLWEILRRLRKVELQVDKLKSLKDIVDEMEVERFVRDLGQAKRQAVVEILAKAAPALLQLLSGDVLSGIVTGAQSVAK